MTNASLGLLMVIAGLVTALLTPLLARENVRLIRAFSTLSIGERGARGFKWWGFFVAAALLAGGMVLIVLG